MQCFTCLSEKTIIVPNSKQEVLNGSKTSLLVIRGARGAAKNWALGAQKKFGGTEHPEMLGRAGEALSPKLDWNTSRGAFFVYVQGRGKLLLGEKL